MELIAVIPARIKVTGSLTRNSKSIIVSGTNKRSICRGLNYDHNQNFVVLFWKNPSRC